MQTGRSYTAHFDDDKSRETYLTWSAAQMYVYNAKVQENNYFWRFHCKFWTPEPMPAPDQKYAHLVDFTETPWMKSVPSAVRGIGAYHWYQAQQRFMRGLARCPRTKRIKDADRQLSLTRPYFSIEKISRKWSRVVVGTKSKGAAFALRVRTHRPHEVPAMLTISMTRAGISVAFSYEEENVFPETQEEIAARLQGLSEAELEKKTLAWDWGAKRNLQLSDHTAYNIPTVQMERVRRKEVGAKRQQRRLAGMQEGSKNSKKQKSRIAKKREYERNVRKDFAHQVTHDLATREGIEVIACEKLNIKGMVKRPKPKYDENGKPLHNGASAKAGLNKALHNAQTGRLKEYLRYKCVREGKLFVEVDPKNSSRECHVCHKAARENRPEQAVFRCTNPECPNYGKEMNADLQASLVLKQRAIRDVRKGIKPKESKKLLRVPRAKNRTNVGVDRPEDVAACPNARMPVEPSEGKLRIAEPPHKTAIAS